MQLALIIGASQKRIRAREVYPDEPKVAFLEKNTRIAAPWVEVENPFLFASASWNGFSGAAWLRQPHWTLPEPGTRTVRQFLQYDETGHNSANQEAEQSFAFLQRRRPSAIYPEPPLPPEKSEPASELKLAGFKGRSLAAPLPLPVQYHSDVLSFSIVEAMIDRDGLVISARVIDNSGSAKADADALSLARRARFTPSKSGENVPQVGKLIFEWFALDLTHTNNVKR